MNCPYHCQHNRDIFGELLGMGEEKISRLEAEWVVW